MQSRNIRRHTRAPIQATIRIGWEDQSRINRVALTRTFDVSESGMRFELIDRLSLRTDIMLRCDKIGLQTRATVRYCVPKGNKYAIGVEFAGGYRWAPPSEEIRLALESIGVIRHQPATLVS